MVRGDRRQRSGLVRALALIALAALSLRALVPPGYMVAPAQGGGLYVALCDGHGPAGFLLDLASGQVVDAAAAHKGKAPAQPTEDAPCLFASAAVSLQPSATPQLVNFDGFEVIDLPRPQHLALGRGLSAPPPWSTGPPSSFA